MPNISSISQFSFVNWGPLTTTWTAPAHCAAQSLNIMINTPEIPPFMGWYAQCSVFGYDCVPTATHSIAATITLPSIPGQGHNTYFSPGIYCPKGYVTVGVASRDGDKPVNSTGVLVPSSTSTRWVYNNAANVLMQILEPSETAVLCCPGSMTGDTLLGCHSTLPDYKPTSGCRRFAPNNDYTGITGPYWYHGATITGYMVSQTASHPFTTETTKFTASDTSSLQGTTIVPIVTLIHKASDLKSTDSTSTSNAAPRLSSKSTTWDGFGALVVISTLDMILGAAILIPY